MKVRDLIELLKGLPENAEVVLSKDGEGNSYSPLSGHSRGKYTPDSTWSGEFRTHDDNDKPVRRPNAVCLWPVN
jgi:hypothetical protein